MPACVDLCIRHIEYINIIYTYYVNCKMLNKFERNKNLVIIVSNVNFKLSLLY